MPAQQSRLAVRSLSQSTEAARLAELQTLLRDRLGAARYDLWFHEKTRFVVEDDRLTIGVPNLHFQEWLQGHFGDAVRESVQAIFPQALSIRYVIDPELFQSSRAEQEEVAAKANPLVPIAESKPGKQSLAKRQAGNVVEESAPVAARPVAVRRNLRKWKTLAQFVVGVGNRVAHSWAMSVVEEPGQAANPLVIYGPVGTGKTHLLEGIQQGLRKDRPELKIVHVTAEEFVNRFVQSMYQNKQHTFRKQFRDCDVLLVDHLNFMAGKKGSQQEFLHTFDTLLAEGAQVVLTCDSHPRLSDDLMPELVDRLIGGAIASLLPPDEETRLGILRARAFDSSPNVPEESLKFIAKRLHGNVRELEGAIHSVRHFARVTGRPVTVELVREALADLLQHAIRVVTMADVDHAICTILRMNKGSLQSKARAWNVSHPRMMAIYLCRKHTAASYGEISIYFGNKTHSTAVAAEKKVRAWIAEDGRFKLGERDWRIKDLLEKVEQMLLG